MDKSNNNMLLFLFYVGFDMLMAYIIFGDLDIPAVFSVYAKIAIAVATVIFAVAFALNNSKKNTESK